MFSQNRETTEEKIQNAIRLFEQKEHKESLEILTQTLEEASINQWQREKYLSLNNIGSNYYGLGDLNEAISYYLKAFDIAEKYLDKNAQMATINNMAVIYFQDRDFEKADQYFLKALTLAKDSEEKIKQGIYALNLALVNNKMNRLNDSKKYLEKASKLLAKNPAYEKRIQIAKAEYLLKNKELDKAFDILAPLSQSLLDQNLRDDYMFQQILLAEIYAKRNNYLLAIRHAENSRKATIGKENLINAFEDLSHYYEKINSYPVALKYRDSILMYKDSIYYKKIDSDFQVNKIKFELLDSQQQLRESKLESVKNKILFYSILAISIAVIIIFLIIFKNYKRNQRQQKKMTKLELEKKKGENLLLEKQLHEKKILSQLEKERHKNQMEIKNRELLSKVFVQSSQQEAIQNLIQEVENHPDELKWKRFKKEAENLNRTFNPSNHWESFFIHFEQTNPDFLHKLRKKHPNLNSGELRFTTYIFINLNNKEIATLLNISSDAVRKRKERLAKKLNLKSSKNLHAYISAI